MSEKSANPEPSPFQRFQELARRLFAVPKEELEREKARYKDQHGKRRSEASPHAENRR